MNPEFNLTPDEGMHEMRSLSSAEYAMIGVGLQRLSDLPAVQEKINDCREAFAEACESAKDTAAEFINKVKEGISDYCRGVYDDVKDWWDHRDREASPEMARLSEGITEGREFGLNECSEAALEIFNPGVIDRWGSMSLSERKEIALLYAQRVADAFELDSYTGVYIEQLDPGTLGYNNGDGSIHLSDTLIADFTTPFEIIDTITHELRHQYQSECVRGLHDVSDEVRNEWAVSTAIYNYDQPSSYDPWGYSYNPLEIDARYAGNTVVRNVSSQMFNDAINQA